MRYALINVASGNVDNVVEIDDLEAWPVPNGYQIIASGAAGIGWSYANGEFTAPAPSASPAAS